MAGISVGAGENRGVRENIGTGQFIRVILADTQAIFRAGLRKIFALEDDIRVVGQAETLPQTQSGGDQVLCRYSDLRIQRWLPILSKP